MIVLFEGMDKVGKTTLIHALNKATNYEHIIIDRGPNSYLVYDEIYKRGHKIDYYKTEMDIRNSSHLSVFCYADPEDIAKRLTKAGEKFEERQGTILEVDQNFHKKMLMSNLDVLCLNTSRYSIDTCVKMILEQIENRKYDFIKLKVKYKDSKYIEYYPSHNTFSEKVLKTLPEFNPLVDEPYYQMLNYSLNHILHKHDINWLNHRQLVYTSNDCISMVQIILGETTEIFVHQRSLNIGKHSTNDLMFIYEWAKENLDYKKLFIHYNVGCPHKFINN